MRGLLSTLWLSLLFTGNCLAFEPQSQWGTNRAQTPLNRERLISSPLGQTSPEQWNPEWVIEQDEETAPTKCEQLGAKTCMCMMTCACLGVFFWALVTQKVRM